jgi:zeaxanthin glucosyltransferase
MSRFLFVSLPLTGHVNPMAAVATALEKLGHEVAWAGSEAFLRPLIGDAAPIFQIPLRAHRGQRERGMAATKSRWEGYIVPHAKVTAKGIETAIAEFAPEVMVVDQHAVAGAISAIRHGLTWASVAPTTMELGRPFQALPKVESWIASQLAAMWTAAGLPGLPPHDLRFSPHLLIGFTGSALSKDAPENAVLVGPALAQRPKDETFPWQWLDPARQRVLITMGTLSMDLAEGFYQRMTEALSPLGDRLQAIVVAPDGAIPDPPEHLLVRSRVPVLELMPKLDLVVSHGGLNTVCEALYYGVPLIIAPIKGDQPINATQVSAAGAGLRINFDRIGPEQLRGVMLSILGDPAFKKAAQDIGASFHAAGGAEAAAVHLERLCKGSESK